MLKPEDLGIKQSDDVREAFSFGCTRLAQKKAFDPIYEIERQAKAELHNNSIDFPVIKGARYVPEAKVKGVLENLGDLQIEFNDRVSEFVEAHDEYKSRMLPIIEKALNEAAKTPEDAATAYKRVLACYPGTGEVKYKFDLSWSVFSISASNTESAELSERETAEVSQVIRDMIVELRDKLSSRMTKILSLVVDGGKLNKRTIDSTFTLISRLKDLNITDDRVLAVQLSKLERFLKGVNKDVIDNNFLTGLADVKKGLETSIDDAVKEAIDNLTKQKPRRILVSNGKQEASAC